MNACKKCNSTNVTQTSDAEINTYKGTDYSVDIEYSNCGSCHREFLTKDQIISNELKVRECKKDIDGLLSSEEIKNIRVSLHLSQAQAASIFGGGQNAFSKYERSEVTQSQAMDKLLRLAFADRYIYEELIGLSSMDNNSKVLTSIDMPEFRAVGTKGWAPSEFNVLASTREIDRPNLKLVA